MVYLLFFIFVSLVVGVLFEITPRIFLCLVTAVFLSVFAAMRGADVAADFTVYEDWYTDRSGLGGFLERPGYFESLYFFVNDCFAATGVPFRFFLGFVAFVAVFIKTHVMISFTKDGGAAIVCMLIYAFTFYLLHEFTQIRAGLAVAFIFLAIQALIREKQQVFVLWVVVAAGFHSSAVMALLLLLPYHAAYARWLDWALLGITGMFYTFAVFGVGLGVLIIDLLSALDPRVALYINLAESGHSDASNPFAIPAMLLLTLALCLMGIHKGGQPTLGLQSQEVKAVVLIRRSMLVGLSCLALFSSIPELSLRLFEINIAFVPILAAIVFSQSGWLLQKFLLLFWASALAVIYIGREEGLVQPYLLFFA